MTKEFAHPKFWATGVGHNQYKWSCLTCKDNKWQDKTTLHQENVGHLLSTHLCPLNFLESGSPPHGVPWVATPSNNDGSFQLDWDAIDHEQLYLPSAQQLTMMASSLAAWLADGDDAISSDEDVSNSPDVEGKEYCPELLQPGMTCSSQHAGDAAPANPAWFLWPNKQTCILDILQHLLHLLFSDVQLQVILWRLAILRVDNVPSTKTLKDIDNSLQAQYRIPSVHYQGVLSHIYYVNHLPSIITQEMVNLHICPHIHHYPEDAGGWLYEIDPTVATPMIHKGHQDFYVFELAKLMDGTMVIPKHWYTKPSALLTSPPFELEYWACTWQAHPIMNGHMCGYVIHTYDTIKVPVSSLLLSFPHLLQMHQINGQPDMCNIIGVYETRGHGVLPWTLTDPVVGNIWHMHVKGHHVLSYMIWLYCDNTSSNMSKKWNKHNLFLFTAAGLPHSLVHKESNIHFLTMSNIAPPLEMLDGIVAQLEHAQMHGIWAWDIEAREMVLMIPAVLVMLGDNPMQSKLACHVGLQGKFFCHNCWVQGVGAESSEHPQALQPDDNTCSIETASHMTDLDRSTHGGVTQQLKGKGHHLETMQGLANTPRTWQHMVEKLHSMFHETDMGIKDTYMDMFIEWILKHVKGICVGTDGFTEAVNAIMQGCSVEEFISPVWRIKGLDPHQDTPVEVLHLILLRFMKYFWCDAISRMNDDQKAELQVQLASFNTSGLGIPPLAAQTFIQYAGSLTGCDFHAICQATPFVLYDLVLHECYKAFLALSSLVPLVWQPCIDNINRHLPKFHILQHLPDHIQCFSPAILFATEGFESYNAMIHDHRLTELPYSDNEHEWLVPGSGVKSLTSLDIPMFCNVIADYFRLTDNRDPLEAGSCMHDKTHPWPLEKTNMALWVPYALPWVKHHLYQTCHSFVATNKPHAAGHKLPLIGSLHEILQICHSPAQQCNQANWLLLKTFKVTGSADIYHLQCIQPLCWVMLPVTAVICCVNVQHNCAGHRCTGSSTVSVYEEHEKMTKTVKWIEHCEPLDLILNTAQMCDASHVQWFHTLVQQLDHDWAIHTGAAAEFNAQKIKILKTL
ncbi:hypothetical protein F5J12DRAFT_906149 [Pisolithus orientalis]|uniref:uncharacterized protein n=1 Tax=Pisolithus orientalis TaxID=936130 RepID=UPI0022256014|nr:uncharacterized protein F5J12DRAFT_906149 [Pisolithus orientalis]KAI6003459.1 hypothetical protein F5J12DRAFT_906149 [Pisolithus orientalis]